MYIYIYIYIYILILSAFCIDCNECQIYILTIQQDISSKQWYFESYESSTDCYKQKV